MLKKFIDLLKEIDIELSKKQLEQFEIYFNELVEWNEKINLTAITDKEGVYIKHFYDSLTMVRSYEFTNQTLLDVGSGAGFPSIPLKIVFPELQVTIIDSLKKRITFLEDLTQKLGVKATLIHGRAEEMEEKNCFDVVTARAVANLRMLGELCIPYVRKDGYFLSMKGPKYKEELIESKTMLSKLNATLEEAIEYDVDNQFRAILRIKKVNVSQKKYPRRFSQIKSSPL